jgi:hypothetical protein
MKGLFFLVVVLGFSIFGGGCLGWFLSLIIPAPGPDRHDAAAERWRHGKTIGPKMIRVGGIIVVVGGAGFFAASLLN